MATTETQRGVGARDAWLAQTTEPVLEPALPIIDPHHHLWDHPGSRYMLDEILRDTGSGHRVLATVFVECASMYRADGPEAMRPVGETEFVNGIAAHERERTAMATRASRRESSASPIWLWEPPSRKYCKRISRRRRRAFAVFVMRPATMSIPR